MRGPSLVQRHLLRRGFGLWFLVRAAFALALLMTLNPPTANGGIVGFGVVTVAAAVGVLEAQRVKETILLANLGLRFPVLVATLAVMPLLGEILLAVLLP